MFKGISIYSEGGAALEPRHDVLHCTVRTRRRQNEGKGEEFKY